MQEVYSSNYIELWRHHWWWRVRHELVMRVVAKLLEKDSTPPQQRNILDVGCIGGLSFDDLSRYGQVYGIEPDQSLINSCPQWRDRIELSGFGPEYSPARRYHLVLMLDVLEHIADDAAALQSLQRLLKPGGQAIITVPALQSLWSVHDVVNLHYRRYNKKGLTHLLKNNGFVIHDLQYFFAWPLGLMYLRKLLFGTKQHPEKLYTVSIPNAPLNKLFSHFSRIEQRLMRIGLRWPLGSSLLAVVECCGEG